MYNLILIIILIIIFCFSFILIFGAPYLPTLNRQKDLIFELANLKKGQSIIDLGCGDGKILLAAAKKGIKAYGYELNPILWLISYLRTYRYRSLVKVYYGDFWHKTWPEADLIYVFLLPKFMAKLGQKIKLNNKSIKVISNAFSFEDVRLITQRDGLFVYEFKV